MVLVEPWRLSDEHDLCWLRPFTWDDPGAALGKPALLNELKTRIAGLGLTVQSAGDKLSGEAKMIWGAQISPDMEKSIRVMIIITGVRSSQITGAEFSQESQKNSEIENELGIEFLE